MAEMMRRIAPGVAVAGTALAVVVAFDKAVHPATSTSAASGGQPQSGSQAGSGTTADDGSSCDTAPTRTGDTVTTEWGPVQVTAKVTSDGTICESTAVVTPGGHGRSIQINDYAVPIIDSETPDQGIAFDAVSGATVTSEGYRDSLQSILDAL